MSQIPGLPDKWKLIHCSATASEIPDHPMGKWRDADILNLLREIAELSNDNKRLRLNHPFGAMYDALKKAQAQVEALQRALEAIVKHTGQDGWANFWRCQGIAREALASRAQQPSTRSTRETK